MHVYNQIFQNTIYKINEKKQKNSASRYALGNIILQS